VKEDSSFHLNRHENAVNGNEVRIYTEQCAPMILVEMEGKPRSLIIDTGSCVSILKPGVSQGKLEVTNLLPHGETGEALTVGRQTLYLLIAGSRVYHTFYSAPSHVSGRLAVNRFLSKERSSS
jgi:hypothetical protein